MRGDEVAGAGIAGHGITFGEEDFAGAAFAEGDLLEEGGHAVVIVLAPAVVGMVMAFGAGDADAEEDLGEHVGHFAGFGGDFVEVAGASFVEGTFAGEKFAGQLVEGAVGGEEAANPVVVGVGFLVGEFLAVHPEDVGPFERPEVGVGGAIEEGVHEAGAAVGAAVGEELAGFGGRGECAGDVEGGAAEKFGVGTEVGGAEVEFAQAGIDEGVDEIQLRRRGLGGDCPFAGDQREEHGDLAHKSRHDGGLAGQGAGGDEAVVGHAGEDFLVGLELGEAGDVEAASVAVGGDDAELLGGAGAQDAFGGGEVEGGDAGVVGGAEGRASGNPVAKSFEFGGIGAEAHATAMGERTAGFLQDEAEFGGGRGDAAAAAFLGDGAVVGGRVRAKDGKFEARLAFGLGVTG